MLRPFAPRFIWKSLLVILPYIWVTAAVVGITAVFSVAGGLVLARARFCRHGAVRCGASLYIALMRCTPSIVMLFIVFYGVPKAVMVWTGVNINFWPKIVFVAAALSMLYSATLAEIFRAAYLAVGREQYEAALCVGLNPRQAMRLVVVPQALITALPNLGNSLTSLLKEGSLAYTIGLIDMMGAGNLVISRNYGARALETYIALAIVYWALTALIDRIFAALDKRLARGVLYVA